MSLAVQPVVEVRFGVGPTFTSGMLLGSATQGILGTNVLGTSAATPVDITTQTLSVSTQRGRDRTFDNYSAATCTIELIDENGDWNPDNTNSPYYGDILPMRQLRITANYNNTTYFLFLGYITSIDWQWDKAADVAFVTLTAEDAFRAFNLQQITTVAGSTAGDLPGERIDQILDEITWPSQLRDLSTGYVTLQDDDGTQRSVLSAMQTVESTELGGLYMHPNGKVTFKGRYDIAQTAADPVVTFDDDGTDLKYTDIDVILDDQDIANSVTVERTGGTAQNRSDATSIATYFTRSMSRTGLIMQTDAQADAQANLILNYRKNPQLLVNSITVDLTEDSNRVAPCLGLDFFEPIAVRRTQPGGSKITADLTVQSIAHRITPESWSMTIGTALPLATAFILGNTVYGRLGESTL